MVVCMSETETELNTCPECGANITADPPEFVGDGTMFRTIGCQDCGWAAVEEWELSATEVHE